jgi:glycosyltransferase involved in cell wall biosynthesis
MQSLLSIVIPCRNEEKFIARCLDSIIYQDYPKENLEVLVVDGASEDGTKEIVKDYSQKFPFIKLLENPKKFTSFGLNVGIKQSRGEIIIRMDAHATYRKDYIFKCVKYLKEYNADNVGGIIKTLPVINTIVAKAIAISLSSSFGAASDFRIGSSTAKEADTVFGGCYKREVFNKIGFFNENLIRSQDLEFNLRLKGAGGKILLVPDIVSYYYPQSALFAFLKHNFSDGIWAIYPLKFVKIPFKLRHYLPLIFVLTLPLSILPYILVSLFFSLKIAIKEKSPLYFFVLPIVFASRHFGYGFGSILGLIKLLIK